MDEVTVQRESGITTLTLNLPEKRNAMTPSLTAAFAAAVSLVRGDPETKVVIVTGAGSAFSAGGDLGTLQGLLGNRPRDNWESMRAFYQQYLSIREIEVPTIAAINGHALGAGLCLALACDMRIAAKGIKLGFTFLSLGLHPGMGATWFVPRLLGTALACELLLSGRVLSAEEAESMGLVNRSVEAGHLAAEVRRLAEAIADKPREALILAKRAIYEGTNSSLMAALDREALSQVLSLDSPEMRWRIEALKHRT